MKTSTGALLCLVLLCGITGVHTDDLIGNDDLGGGTGAAQADTTSTTGICQR
ncbi:hypothetical protein D3C87_1045780 [compost metagenome]